MNMAARTTFTKSMALGTTALAAMGLTACNDSEGGGLATSAEFFEAFDVPVGEPIAVISATRGDGASVDFDQFTVTFNNPEGTSITIGTPEGEDITFTEDDPATWIGEDPVLGGLGRLVSDDGDLLEVFIGDVTVPTEPDNTGQTSTAVRYSRYQSEEQLAFATGRLDEDDTREGFETYMAIGDLTQSDELPRLSEDAEDAERGEDGVCLSRCAGDLITGTAFYNGRFVATVYQDGEMVSDEVTGSTYVGLDFANGDVEFNLYGGYYFDDVDDDNAGTNVTKIVDQTGTLVSTIGTLTDSALVDFDTETGTFLTGITPDTAKALTGFDVTTGDFVTAVNPDINVAVQGQIGVVEVLTVSHPVFSVIGSNFVVGVDPDTSKAIVGIVNEQTLDFVTGLGTPDTADAITEIVDVETGTFVTGLAANGSDVALTSLNITTVSDGPDWFKVNLSDNGNAEDISFENGVTYTGTLDGYVEVPLPAGTNTNPGIESVDVAGEFGGGVFGPGSSAFDVLDTDDGPFEPTQGEVLDATATAGVFEANDGYNSDTEMADPSLDNAGVEIVGAFGAESCTYCSNGD